MAAPVTRFFVDAFASALELGIATPDDVLKHATPDVLARHLPRPLWAKLIAACLAAPRTDARLVVGTIGVADLCEHVPATILWACLAEIANRALGKSLLAMAPAPVPEVGAVGAAGVAATATVAAAAGATAARTDRPDKTDKTDKVDSKLAVGTSPGTQPAPAAPSAASSAAPGAPMSVSGSQPVSTHVPTRAATEPPAPLGDLPPVGSRAPTARPGTPPPARTTTGSMPAISTTAPSGPLSGGNGLRTSSAGASTRRPQAQAQAPTATVPAQDPTATTTAAPPGRERKGPRTAPPSGRRGTTATDFEIDTDVNEWKAGAAPKPVAEVVDDDLVDWAQAEETATGGVDLERKR